MFLLSRRLGISLLCFCSGGLGQQVMILPAPPWTGQVNDANQHVFYDSAARQLVVVPAASAGPVRQIRFDLPNAVNPAISYVVGRKTGGGIRYSYVLTDDPNSRQRSKSVSFLLPDHDSGLAVGGAWPTSSQASSTPDRTATVALAAMRWIRWEDSSSGPGKITGLTLNLTSTYLPGFADAVIEGLVPNPPTAAAASALDSTTAAQLARFLDPATQGHAALVLGPLFRPGASQVVIASNYSYGIHRLAQSGSLSGSSPYVQQALEHLGAFLRSQGSVAFMPVQVAPSAGLEQQIQAGLNLALP